GAFVYYLVFPVAWPFFASFEQQGAEGTMAIALEPKVNEYLSLVMRLIFAFGLSFELPVVMTLLARARIMTSDGMRKKRRYAILLAFVAAAILTPPDPLSQIGLALPIILLYEISIYCAVLIERSRAKREALDDSDSETEDA
ncbi:MAG: twin-arginine translocase subunit TatC, partial [Pseudomonadota bacterium]|nr:twin-arginine translocase subunit TatC [Pseudomonadota bacterium]